MKSLANRWIGIALFNFLLAALFGALLRYAFVKEVEWLNYKSFQDAHSHLALLGWAFQGLFAFLTAEFIPDDRQLQKKYNSLFWINEILVLLVSIGFIAIGNRMLINILLVLLSFSIFYFIHSFIKDVPGSDKQAFSFRLAKTGLVFLGVSFIGVYSMVPVMLVSGAKKLILYYLGVQFFLHFQYNGWFVFAVLSLLFRLAEQNRIFADHHFRLPAKLLAAGIVLTFFLSVYWAYQHKYFLWVAALSGIIQLFAAGLAWRGIKKSLNGLWQVIDSRFRILLVIVFSCFFLKLIMQAIIIVPYIASLAFTIRNYVIAYLHLIFIGFLTFFLFGWGVQQRHIIAGRLGEAGIYAIAAGFIIVELILFIQGTMLWTGKGFISFYYPLLFLVTLLLPLGLGLILISRQGKQYPYH